jgi:hypothetical protein
VEEGSKEIRNIGRAERFSTPPLRPEKIKERIPVPFDNS